MSTVFSVRKRTLFQPLKKPKLTGEQKKAQKARSGELEARLDSFADTINREVKAMAQEFNKSVSYVRGRLFAGSKGAAFIRRTRAANKIRVYDAYLHHKTKMLHEDPDFNDRLTLDRLRQIVRDEEPHYSDRSAEEKEAWVTEYKDDMKERNTQRRVNRKAEQQDATFACRHIATEMESLEMRTGVKGCFFAVRSDMLQIISPFFACTPDVAQFFNVVLGKTPDQIIALFEMWAIGGMRGVFGINAKNAIELKKDVRRLIQKGLDGILKERYGERDTTTAVMNYATYGDAIVAKHNVRLTGWTYEKGVVNPGDISPVEELRKLCDALVSGACHWEIVPEPERTVATGKKRKRATKDGETTGAKKRKTAARPAAPKTAAPKPTGSKRKPKKTPARVDDATDSDPPADSDSSSESESD